MKGRPLTEEELERQSCNAHHTGNNTTSESNSTHTEPTCYVPTLSFNSTTSSFNATISDNVDEHYTQKPKDYTVFLAALTAFIAFWNLLMIIFFNAPFKRKMANKEEPKNT